MDKYDLEQINLLTEEILASGLVKNLNEAQKLAQEWMQGITTDLFIS